MSSADEKMPQPGAAHPLHGLYLIRYGRDVQDAAHTVSLADPPAGMQAKDTHEFNPSYIQHYLSKLRHVSPLGRNLLNIDEDFARNHIVERRQAEDSLRSGAQAKGITPENEHPLYFILHHQMDPAPPQMEGKVVIAIPAEHVPSHLVSFTVDDSFYSFPKISTQLPDPAHGMVFNTAEISRFLQQRGWLPTSADKPRYFEAQLWTRRIEDFNPVIAPPQRPGKPIVSAALLRDELT